MTRGPKTCIICLESDPEVGLTTRQCCNTRVCQPCLRKYVNVSIKSAISDVKCPSDACRVLIAQSNVIELLDPENVELYCQLKVDNDNSNDIKTCPKCKYVTARPKSVTGIKLNKTTAVECKKCHFEWCFDCHSPLHPDASCQENRKADKAFTVWASQREGGQRNAWKCPNCKIYIQRSEGCRHMTCSQCEINFCYDCGKKRNANNACGCKLNPVTTAAADIRTRPHTRQRPITTTPSETERSLFRRDCAKICDSPSTIAGIAVGIILFVVVTAICVGISELAKVWTVGWVLFMGYVALLVFPTLLMLLGCCSETAMLFAIAVEFTSVSLLFLPIVFPVLCLHYLCNC